MRLIDADLAIAEVQWAMSDSPSITRDDWRAIIEALSEVPSAQPERKRGKWIEDGYSHYKAVCSECGEPCATYVMDAPRDRFCKWCGADMRGEQDE